jgi:hypothetical protein
MIMCNFKADREIMLEEKLSSDVKFDVDVSSVELEGMENRRNSQFTRISPSSSQLDEQSKPKPRMKKSKSIDINQINVINIEIRSI